MRVNIAVKLAGVFTLLCLSLLMLVALIATVITGNGIETEAHKRLDNDVQVTLHTFDYFAQDALASAQILAANPQLVRYALTRSDASGQSVRDLMAQLPPHRLVRVFDRTGRLVLERGVQGVPPAPSGSGIALALADETVRGIEPIDTRGLAIRGIAPIHHRNEVIGAVLVGSWLDQPFVEQIRSITGIEVGIAAGDSRSNRWLAQTIRDAQAQPIDGEVPCEVVQKIRAMGTYRSETVRFGEHAYLSAFAPLFGDYGQFVGLLYVGVPREPLTESTRRSQLVILALAVLGAIAASFLAAMLARTITNPIRQMVDQASAIAHGRLDGRLAIDTGDELEQLAQAFNHMAESLSVMKIEDQNCNPLTRLPGNRSIEAEVARRLHEPDNLAVLYIDLDHFKAYNDKFGFEAGDRIIQYTASTLQQAIQIVDNAEDYLGHIGGDDFIVVTTPRAAERLGQEIIRLFDAELPGFYPEEDRKRGYIVALDRRGLRQQFPLVTLSIAIVTNERRQIRDFLELASVAAEVKKYAKSIEGSSVARDRRLDRTGPLNIGSTSLL
ncbi:MAG: HAMP domain-containing protein [bacterium]|nr:HAMP domain-containing protein [bacterium]